MYRLLVISDDPAVHGYLCSAGKVNYWQIEVAAHAGEALAKVQSGIAPDLIVLDLPKGNADGVQILRTLRGACPALPIVLIDYNGASDTRQESIRENAFGYVMRPFEDRQLDAAIRHSLSAMEATTLTDLSSDDVEPIGNDNFFIGVSPVMRKLRGQAAQLAETDVPVLILGEPGSGKETIARLLHRLSVRSGFEFTRVNCAALPEDLLEWEIFGCAAGSAAASSKAKRGKLEMCGNGTVFLDEITKMPLRLQSRMMEVLQTRQYVKRGALERTDVDIRVVAASSASIDQAVSERRLLPDLSRLLSANRLQVPALRERKEELPFLSRHFMHRLASHYGLPQPDFTSTVSEAWQAYDWPGNLRELEKSVKRYLVVGDKEFVFEKGPVDGKDEAQDIAGNGLQSGNVSMSPSRQARADICGYKSLRSLLQGVKEEAERNAIALALEKTGWNRKAAARLLKTSYRTVLYKIEQYQMSSTDPSAAPAAHEFGTRKAESVSRKSDPRRPIADVPRIAGGTLSHR